MAGGDQMSPVSRIKLLRSLSTDDLFEVIMDALAVAAQSHPHELEQRRDSILQMLHDAKASAAVDVGEAAISASEQAARINTLLVSEATSDEAVIESLRELKAVRMTFDTLVTTKVGRAVGALRKHASQQVRQLASGLLKSWKAVADEHIRSSRNTSATSTPAVAEEANVKTATPLPRPTSKRSNSNQETPATASRGTPKDATKLKEAPVSISDEARVARAKRKFNAAYHEAAAVKKQRSIRVINVPAGKYTCPA